MLIHPTIIHSPSGASVKHGPYRLTATPKSFKEGKKAGRFRSRCGKQTQKRPLFGQKPACCLTVFLRMQKPPSEDR